MSHCFKVSYELVVFQPQNYTEHIDVENKTIFHNGHRDFSGEKKIKINEAIMAGLVYSQQFPVGIIHLVLKFIYDFIFKRNIYHKILFHTTCYGWLWITGNLLFVCACVFFVSFFTQANEPNMYMSLFPFSGLALCQEK